MDKVIIQNLRAMGILGIHDWERVTPREIVINAVLYTDTRQAARTDDIADCINYSEMAKKLRTHAESAACQTVEALANELASLCLNDTRILKVVLRVDKPGAVPEAQSVAVEVEREQGMS